MQSAGAIVTCDNEFALNVNSKEITKGNKWTQLGAATITTVLKQGENTIVILGKNAGDTPNLAGLFFEAKINFVDGESLTIKSDKSWQFAAKFPAKAPVRRWTLKDLNWQPVTVVPAIDAWTKAIAAVATRAARSSFARLGTQGPSGVAEKRLSDAQPRPTEPGPDCLVTPERPDNSGSNRPVQQRKRSEGTRSRRPEALGSGLARPERPHRLFVCINTDSATWRIRTNSREKGTRRQCDVRASGRPALGTMHDA